MSSRKNSEWHHWMHSGITECIVSSTFNSQLSWQFTMKSLGVSPIYYEFKINFANSLSINYFSREFIMKSVSDPRFHYNANKPWIHLLFRESAMNSLSFKLIDYESTIYFANFYLIHKILFHLKSEFFSKTFSDCDHGRSYQYRNN